MSYAGPHGTHPHSFPNIVPTIEAVLALGFEIIADSYNTTIFSRSLGESTFFVKVEHETAGWDISDHTSLSFAAGERPSDHGSGKWAGANVKYMGTHKFPTVEEVRTAILYYVNGHMDRASEKLRKTYAEHQKWAALTEGLKDLP